MSSSRETSWTRTASVALAVTVMLVLTAPVVIAQVGETDAVGGGSGLGLGDFVADLSLTEGLVLAAVVTTVAIVVSLFFLGGTKFITPENVLENDSRRAIYEFVQENPGTHLRATADALDLSTTNVLWHLRKLEDAELVNHKKFEGYKLLYPTEGGVEGKKQAIANAVLSNENASNVLEFILANPGAHQRQIARALDVNHGTVRWHLRKMNEAGLILQVEKEYTTQYYITELGNQALAEGYGDAPTLATDADEGPGASGAEA